MKKLFLVFVLCGRIILHGATVSGYVADANTGETIIGVNVIVEETDLGATTDLHGFFVIRGIAAGLVTITFSHIAYKEMNQTVHVGTEDIFLGTVKLSPAPIEGEAVEVTAYRGNIIQKDMDISGFKVDPIVLKEVPQLKKDVFKLVKFSPSVTISDPYSPLYYVRGSDPGENLVQLDGMTIYNPHHMMSLEAIFNPYAIKNIEMLVGGFDAQHGGRNSSILYITSREGHREEIHGEFKPSTSGLVGAVEFPVRVGGTAMLSGRLKTSLVTRVLMGMPNAYIDLNGAYQTTIRQTKIRLSTFYAQDHIDYDFARLTLYFPDSTLRSLRNGFLTKTQNVAVGLQTRSIVTPNTVFESHVYYSAFRVSNNTFFKFDVDDTTRNEDIILNYETRLVNKISDITGKASLSYFSSFNQTMKLGYEVNYYRFSSDVGFLARQSFGGALSSTLHSFYLQDKIEIGDLLLKIGVRNTRFFPENRWRLAPRASISLKLNSARIKAAWGRYHQYITAMNTQDYEINQSLDYYYPLRNLKPLTSIHYVLGIEGKLLGRIDYSITAYYKDLNTLYRFDYNNTIGSVYSYESSLEKGIGEAYGAEFLMRGKLGRLSGWISYGISRSTRSYPSIQDGKEFLYDGDQTHNLKSILLYKLTPEITASSTFQLASGFPKTWETGMLSHYTFGPLENAVGFYPIQITPVKNNVRFPPRILWDVGWKKRLRSGFGYHLAEYLGADESYFTLTLQNILFLRRNPVMYIYFPDEKKYYAYDYEYFPIIIAGYSIKF